MEPFFGKVLKKYREKKRLTQKSLASKLGIDVQEVKWWEESGVSPDKSILREISQVLDVSLDQMIIRAGYLPEKFAEVWMNDPAKISTFLQEQMPNDTDNESVQCVSKELKPILKTDLGSLYKADCLELLTTLETHFIDCIFADPPFNLGKDYGKNG